MKAQKLLISFGVALSTVAATTSAANAAAFTSNISQSTNPKADIILNSITQRGQTFSNFSYVNEARIIYNTPRAISDPRNSGAASTDKGDNATAPFAPNEDPTAAEIAAYLGNNNLNNIIDTEDMGSFVIDIFFDSQIVKDNTGLDNIFFWERGMNSYLDIYALDDSGNVISNPNKPYNINQTTNRLNYAGFQIDTTEIGGPQHVGSWGISLDALGVTQLSGLRLKSYASNPYPSNGPDFKFIARQTGPNRGTTVPEPTALLGLGAVATLAFLRRRQLKSDICR